MSKKLAIKSVYDQLKTVQVTTLDGESRVLNVMLWTGARDEETDITPYSKPACFLETTFSDGVPVGAGATSYDIVFRVMIEQEQYNTEGDINMELSLLDLPDNVHRALNQFKPDNCAPLYQSGTQLDHTQGNTNFCVLEYSSHLVDLTASANDVDSGLYVTQTLTSPVLQIDETVYVGAIPESGGGTTATLLGSIINGSGTTIHQWWTYSGVPNDSLGSNGDYYRDEDNGDVYYKSGGSYALVGNILGGVGTSAPMFTNVTLSNDLFPLTAVKGKCYILEDGVLASDSTIDVSNLTNEGDEFMFLNRDRNRNISFLGATVYYADERVADGLLWQSNVWVRMANGKLRVILG